MSDHLISGQLLMAPEQYTGRRNSVCKVHQNLANNQGLITEIFSIPFPILEICPIYLFGSDKKSLVCLASFKLCYLFLRKACSQFLLEALANATDSPIAASGCGMGEVETSFAKTFEIFFAPTSQWPNTQNSSTTQLNLDRVQRICQRFWRLSKNVATPSGRFEYRCSLRCGHASIARRSLRLLFLRSHIQPERPKKKVLIFVFIRNVEACSVFKESVYPASLLLRLSFLYV